MEISKTRSFFQDIKSREINGFRVRKRPYAGNETRDLEPTGTVAVEHQGEPTPPMALSFCKTNRNAHILALTDERGFVTILNTGKKYMDSAPPHENTEKVKLYEWIAHDNAIFDICWIKEDTNILTASGDQSIKIWNVQDKKCIRALMGHTGSVKSIGCHPTNQDLIISGSRDGSFALWDTRSSKSTCQTSCIRPTSVIHEAHTYPGRRRGRRTKAESMSITSVLFVKDEVSVATAGAVDSIIKFWDTRHFKMPFAHACPNVELLNEKEKRSNGISSLSQDMNGVFLTASCMNHRIYLYNLLQLEKGPIRIFSGGRTESFFVKTAISPDAAHILSGSSDGNALIWQVNNPHLNPIKLRSHDGEVTAVDWCQSKMGKVATCSDDFTVRLWNVESSCYTDTRSPSSIRKRVMAFPRVKPRRLFSDEFSSDEFLNSNSNSNSNACSNKKDNVNSPPDSSMLTPEVSTPKDQKKTSAFLSYDVEENLEKSHAVENNSSPSTVLNPPSSLKRKTIRDYFSIS